WGVFRVPGENFHGLCESHLNHQQTEEDLLEDREARPSSSGQEYGGQKGRPPKTGLDRRAAAIEKKFQHKSPGGLETCHGRCKESISLWSPLSSNPSPGVQDPRAFTVP